MTEKPNYFKVGIFILIAAALIVAGLVLFGSGALSRQKAYFETYFSESVSGLSKGSAVELNGVKIGTVEEVSFVRRTYKLPVTEDGASPYEQYIRVVMAANQEEMPRTEVEGRESRLKRFIEQGLRLRLASNFITGQSALEAVFLDPARFPVMEVPWKPIHTYVPSAPSTLTAMAKSLDDILIKLREIKFDEVANNLNQLLVTVHTSIKKADLDVLSQKVQRLATDADEAMVDVDFKALSDQTVSLITELRQSNSHLKALIASDDLEQKLDNIPVLVDEFSRTLDSLDKVIQSKEPDVERILQNLRQLSENLNYLSQRLKDNPSEFLFSQPPQKQEN